MKIKNKFLTIGISLVSVGGMISTALPVLSSCSNTTNKVIAPYYYIYQIYKGLETYATEPQFSSGDTFEKYLINSYFNETSPHLETIYTVPTKYLTYQETFNFLYETENHIIDLKEQYSKVKKIYVPVITSQTLNVTIKFKNVTLPSVDEARKQYCLLNAIRDGAKNNYDNEKIEEIYNNNMEKEKDSCKELKIQNSNTLFLEVKPKPSGSK